MTEYQQGVEQGRIAANEDLTANPGSNRTNEYLRGYKIGYERTKKRFDAFAALQTELESSLRSLAIKLRKDPEEWTYRASEFIERFEW